MIVAVGLILQAGCSGRARLTESAPPGELRARVISVSACRGDDAPVASGRESDAEECVAYRYDGADTLWIRHLNAAINCCADSVGVEIEVGPERIFVHEYEPDGAAQCDCICLRSVSLFVAGVAPGLYRLDVGGARPSPVGFWVDLAREPRGVRCVERHGYPWN
jgi:hypothetical protein